MRTTMAAVLMSALTLTSMFGVTGCESVSNSKPQQGTTAAGASTVGVAKENRILRGLCGGALGPGGGYLIGAQLSKADQKHRDEAIQASRNAEKRPATVADVGNSTTADLNRDGYVTMDEVVAMKNAGLSDQEMVRRLQATSQIFELTSEQEKYLRDHGVDNSVVGRIGTINQDVRDQADRDQKMREIAKQDAGLH